MPKFSVNTHRQDAYKKFKFRVKWDGRHIPGVTHLTGLRRSTAVITSREGSDPNSVRKSPGETTYEPITLERGRTHDSAFEQWANKVYNLGSGQESSLADYRKDIIVELLNEAGQVVLAFHVFRAWPSEYEALGELRTDRAEFATERLTLQHEGWERDYDVSEPEEPSFDEPNST